MTNHKRPGRHLFILLPFHVLSNSLLKVLCNFPSRYLFAIGRMEILSLGRSVPATPVCTLKQTDSMFQAEDSRKGRKCYGSRTHFGVSSKETGKSSSKGHHPAETQRSIVPLLMKGDPCDGLISVHSPLLGESLLFSSPLNDMIKFTFSEAQRKSIATPLLQETYRDSMPD